MRPLLALAALVALLAAGCGGEVVSGGGAAESDYFAASDGIGPSTSGDGPQRIAPKVATALKKDTTTTSSSTTSTTTTTTRRPTTTTAPPTTSSQTSTTRRSSGGGGTGDSTSSAVEREVVTLVNKERARAGCDPLREDDRLTTAAGLHSKDMLDNNYFSHESPTEGSPDDRAAAQGYTSGVGENIAAGQPTAESVVEGWMDSQGHRENILNCEYKSTGVGFVSGSTGYRTYWTQMFGNV